MNEEISGIEMVVDAPAARVPLDPKVLGEML
jgi:hypothetical protein